MKKILSLILLALLPLVANAYDAEIDGIYYNLHKNGWTAEVTRNPNKYTGAVNIPATVTYEGFTYSVTTILNEAFYECTSLTSVTIGNSVTTIGYWAFLGCSGLTSVTIPNSVTILGDSAFLGCSSLTSITIPNSVISIGDGAFEGCSSLSSVQIADLSAWCNIKFGSYKANPLYYAHHLYLNDEEIKDLVIPNDVTSIGKSALCGCSGLTSITIPNSVTSIGDYAFYGCI